MTQNDQWLGAQLSALMNCHQLVKNFAVKLIGQQLSRFFRGSPLNALNLFGGFEF